MKLVFLNAYTCIFDGWVILGRPGPSDFLLGSQPPRGFAAEMHPGLGTGSCVEGTAVRAGHSPARARPQQRLAMNNFNISYILYV